MADRYTSLLALVLDERLEEVGSVVDAARAAKDIDRAAAVRGAGDQAYEVHWGGRMQKAVVRVVPDERDGGSLVRTEAYIGAEGLLLQALARQLRGRVRGVRDLTALADRDTAWMNRLAIGAVDYADGIVTRSEGEGTWWVRTHGAARFDVPDLEVYGCNKAQVPGAEAAVAHVHDQLLRGGLQAALSLPDGTPVRLVPVLESWQHVPVDWPGVGRAGQERGEGLDGPRATLSILHKRRLGRYRTDLEGVLKQLPVTS
jgi:hypothetical protein